MDKTVEIYFDDLTIQAQEYLLKEFNTTKKGENWDVFPITFIACEVDDDMINESSCPHSPAMTAINP
jgi:hypothetical protein